MFSEIERVLKVGGRYVCVSLLQPHIIHHVAHWFVDAGWPVRIIRCTEADENKKPEERIFPVFAIIATKFKKMEKMKPVIEISLSTEGKLMRLDKPASLVDSVRGCQQFAALRARLAKGGADSSIEEACLQLRAEDSQSVKYSLFLTERNVASNLSFAAFIVPQGREVEWMFATAEGRRQLADSASCQRLIVVHLGRDASFSSLETVQSELSPHILEFCPPDLPIGYKVPFLSAGNENVGSRVERCRGRSQISGDYVVEDVKVGNVDYRRLIFLSRPNLTQSEAVLKNKKDKNKKTTSRIVDITNLVSTYHSLMIGALGVYLNQPPSVLIVGLGGGSLPSYIHHTFPLANVHVVELDPAIADVASAQFAFKADDRLTLSVEDGLDFLKNTDKQFSIVMLDVDSKDIASGMSCPPPDFVDSECLEMIRSCLVPEGMFVLNLVCRDTLLRKELMSKLTAKWNSVAAVKLEEEVNEVIFSTSNRNISKSTVQQSIMNGFKLVNDHVKKSIKSKEDLIDLESSMKMLTVGQ